MNGILFFDVSKTRTALLPDGNSSQSSELHGHPAGQFSWKIVMNVQLNDNLLRRDKIFLTL